MKVETQDYNNFTVVQLKGDFDADSIETFQNTITGIIAKHNSAIVLSMADVDFIDSEGLERLLWARDYCNENNCNLRLSNLTENCKKVLEITRLESEFDCYSELEEAVKSFA